MKSLVMVCLCAGFVLAFLLPAATSAQTTVTASDDGYVRGGVLSGNTYNASDKEALRVRYATADTNKRRTFLKFDLSSFSGPVGSAKLTIWVSRAVSSTYNTITNPNLFADSVYVYATGDSWTETTLSWNTAPPIGQFLFLQAVKRKASADPDTMYSWDVTTYVKAEFAGDKKVSFVMADTVAGHGTDLRMYSKETFGYEPALVISSATAVETPGNGVPDRFALQQNFPNPFNPSTSIGYQLPAAGMVRLVVHDLLGREVAVLVNDTRNAGSYAVTFDASGLGSGTYLYTLTAGTFRDTKRMVILK